MKFGSTGVIMLGLTLLTPAVGYFTVFRPQTAEIKRAKADVEHMESMLKKLQEETARNKDLVRANEETQRMVKTVEERLPSNKDIDALVRQVSDMAVESGLTPPAMRSAKILPAGQYFEQPVDMELSGSFAGFQAFMERVEKMPRITRVHDLKLEAGMTDDVEVRSTFTLSIYFQDEQNVASAGGTN